jgi:F-type H+-transporting ATPase subunit a
MLSLIPLESGGYEAPSVEKDFWFDGGFIPGADWVNKPLIQAVIAALLVILFWYLASRKLKLVPSKGQFISEYLYDFIRNGVARDALGHDFRTYTPYLLGLFSFIWVNNLFGLFAFFVYPTMASIGYAWALALLSWIIYNGAGLKRHGMGYLRSSLFPKGVPPVLYILITPIEFMSNFLIRPLTLGLRLFGNMFAGHLVVLVFVVGGSFLLLHGGSWFYNVSGGLSLLFSFAIFALELLVATLQAYIFTVLTAQYISSSLAEDH